MNELITTSETPLPKEVKPRMEDKLANDAILVQAARYVFKEPIFQFSTDFSNFFQQFGLHPRSRPISNFIWLSPDGSRAEIISETSLGFGVAASSNIAQRFAWAVIRILERRFDAEERPYFDSLPPDSKQGRWVERRRRLNRKRKDSTSSDQENVRLYSF